MAITTVLCLIVAGTSLGQDAPQYRAVFGESEVLLGQKISGWDAPQNAAKLDDRLLFDKATGVIRYLEKLDAKIERTGPFIELFNGDVLLGIAVGYQNENTLSGVPAYFDVRLRGSLVPFGSADGTVRIKANRVKRLVFSGESTQKIANGKRNPGTVVLTNGQILTTEEFRWSATGLRGISDTSSFNARWDELAMVVPPVNKVFSDMDAILDDLLAPAVDPEARIARMVTMHGAILTYRADMLVPQQRENKTLYHAVQPAWSLDSISAAFDEIAVLGYRAHNEIPLSSFPATLLEKRSLIGFSPSWKRNKNVRGGILASGTMLADVGIGTHSYSKIAFAIPADIVTRFRGYVGIDRVAQGGGCVRVKVFRGISKGDDVEAYHSGHLIGTNGYTPFDINDFTKCDRIVLETGFGDQGRPTGADPFDIRDDVSWMRALLTINVTELQSRAWWGFQQYSPQIASWTIPDNFKSHVRLSAYWNPDQGRWMSGLSWKSPVATAVGTPIMEFSQKVVLTLNNSWVTFSGASDGIGDKTATVRVTVNDEAILSMDNEDVNLAGKVGSFDTKHWALGAMLGEEVEIKVQVMPREAGTYKPQGFTIGSFGLQPVISGLSEDGELPVPDVPLSSLKPISFELAGYTEFPQVGVLKDDVPLQTGGVRIADGYVFPGEGKFVYKLMPNYKEFFMIVGREHSTNGSFGPCEILVDEEVVWTSQELFVGREAAVISDNKGDQPDGVFLQSAPSAFVRISIPSGHASLTIRSKGKPTDFGFLGGAGFTSD
ncbi:MAG: hypothetical protein HON92_13185 [Planctomycetaceae bacterium]|nr:hypothetical protein [Planctomycetaceae bacterium]